MNSHKQAVTVALIGRWSALLAHATCTARAASLLCEDTSTHNHVRGFLLPPSEFFAHMPREPAAPSNEMSLYWSASRLRERGRGTLQMYDNVCHFACLFKSFGRNFFNERHGHDPCILRHRSKRRTRAAGITRNIFNIPSCHEVVCFAAGNRKIYTSDLQKHDVHCRKLLRRVVGPPADIDWNQPWHTILHAWHRRIDQQLEYHGFKMWSTQYLSEYWKFANYVALLDDNRWVKRILHWNPGGGRPGRPFFQWQTPLQNFCRWHHLGNWIDTAGSTALLFQYYTDFISFCQR